MPSRRTRSPSRPASSSSNLPDGALCASFANTASAKRSTPGDYAALLQWLESHGAVSAAEGRRFANLAQKRPEEAAAVLARAERLRALLTPLFDALAKRRQPSAKALAAFNDFLLETLPHRCVAPAPAGWRWDWAPGREDDLGRPLWPVITSMAEVLTSGEHQRVGQCAASDCDLFFIGLRRKWCASGDCERRERNRRYYRRKARRDRRRERDTAFMKKYGRS